MSNICICVTGYKGVGKTTLIASLIKDNADEMDNTDGNGTNIIDSYGYQIGDKCIHFLDGPSYKYKRIFENYTKTTDAYICVLDASDLTVEIAIPSKILKDNVPIIVVVNKMDYASALFLQEKFEYIVRSIDGIDDRNDVTFIPASGETGANIDHRVEQMKWYQGPTLAEAVQAVKRRKYEEVGFNIRGLFLNSYSQTFCGVVLKESVKMGDIIKDVGAVDSVWVNEKPVLEATAGCPFSVHFVNVRQLPCPVGNTLYADLSKLKIGNAIIRDTWRTPREERR